MGMLREDRYQDDARLVTRAAGGDQAAFRQLFEAYSPLVYRIALRMLGDQNEAADLAQDVFVRAYERLSSLRDGQAFQAWITRLAVNMAHDRSRRRRPATLSLDAPPPGMDTGGEWHLAAADAGNDAGVLSAELSARVQAALLTLSAEHRIVVVLHHLEEMAVDEIAQLLRVPPGTVKSRLSRARADLRRKLEEYVEG